MSVAKAPNFFIVGAPKCGTTALYTYLRQHPDIFMPSNKEPRFFAADLDSGSDRDGEVFVRDFGAYLSLFQAARKEIRRGEATALYLFSRDAARNIHEFDPESRIIIMLRNPVDVMYAFHAERYYNGNEDIKDFQKALAAESARREGRLLPKQGAISAALQYRAVVRFAEQVDRFLTRFGRERVHLIFFEDLKSDPRGVYRGVLQFLGLPTEATPELTVVNASKRHRSLAVANVIRHPPAPLISAVRSVLPRRMRSAIARGLIDLNTERGRRPPLDRGLRQALTSEFGEEIQRLERLSGRDLEHWRSAELSPVDST